MAGSAWKKFVGVLVGVALVLGAGAGAGWAEESGEKATFEDVKRQLAETARALGAYSAEQRDEAVKKAKPALDALDARLDRLEQQTKAKWAEMDETARERAAATLEALRRQRNTVAEWYGGLQHSSQEAWERTKKGFSDAYDALKGSWEKAEKDLEAEP
ncbi:MAG: hypothetical protein SCH98_10535 [Deferrisomatales bacterium]|nr:hypothetical protein [Deferrisomatales bacterium]